MKEHKSPPMASSLIESMRDLGYSFETALADIIDNSITAKATEVSLLCDADRISPVIAIVDNGTGMSIDELLVAMRPGSKNPLDARDKNDLGRFGLGLKTASFSQCRRLTVISRRKGKTIAARWDLDFVADRDEWILQVLDPKEIGNSPFIDELPTSGTLVLWETLDRLTDETQKTSVKDHLYERLDHARAHLELVFHRFLAGERPLPKLKIRINNHEVEPFDPFCTSHPATQRLEKESIRLAGGSKIHVETFILPHHKKVSRQEWEKNGGEAGYLKNQGFYVYRAGRLIVHGTWFRLAKQAELTKLSRVKVDLPNELDHLWKLDVKKASASPPLIVRQRLKAVIDKISGASKRVYTGRGARILGSVSKPLWSRIVDKNEIRYEINRTHPTFEALQESLGEKFSDDLDRFFSFLESSLPIDLLYTDVSNNPEQVVRGGITDEDMAVLVQVTVSHMRLAGQDAIEVVQILRSTEPFQSNWERAEPLIHSALAKTE